MPSALCTCKTNLIKWEYKRTCHYFYFSVFFTSNSLSEPVWWGFQVNCLHKDQHCNASFSLYSDLLYKHQPVVSKDLGHVMSTKGLTKMWPFNQQWNEPSAVAKWRFWPFVLMKLQHCSEGDLLQAYTGTLQLRCNVSRQQVFYFESCLKHRPGKIDAVMSWVGVTLSLWSQEEVRRDTQGLIWHCNGNSLDWQRWRRK